MTSTATQQPAVRRNFRWRVVDIVVASVIGVASGAVFLVWNVAYEPVTGPLGALLPGMQALGHGFWLFAGVLAGLIIRKPGAALYGELLAATVSALVGNQWGVDTLVSGVVQGLGAEIVFALFLYSNYRVYVAMLAGMGAALAMVVHDLIVWYAGAGSLYATVYTICGVISGAVIAGLMSWLAMRALARTGVLSRFAAGESAVRV